MGQEIRGAVRGGEHPAAGIAGCNGYGMCSPMRLIASTTPRTVPAAISPWIEPTLKWSQELRTARTIPIVRVPARSLHVLTRDFA